MKKLLSLGVVFVFIGMTADLPRAFEFSGNQLIVKPTSPDEPWRVTWEHY
jgi:hypothetical protein